MYKRNGNISISGLTPEMFESATDPILECSNLYKIICDTMMKWQEISNDSIIKVYVMFIIFIYLLYSLYLLFLFIGLHFCCN